MKRYPKDPITEAAQEQYIDEGEVDLVDLLEKSKEVLRREIRNLSTESLKGKLKPQHGEALSVYIRLLNNMVKEEKDRLKKLTKEELEALAKDETFE